MCSSVYLLYPNRSDLGADNEFLCYTMRCLCSINKQFVMIYFSGTFAGIYVGAIEASSAIAKSILQ